MLIGQLSRRTGASPRSLRYYERQAPLRSQRLTNGYRDYPEQAATTVVTIQSLLAAGLTTGLIHDLYPV